MPVIIVGSVINGVGLGPTDVDLSGLHCLWYFARELDRQKAVATATRSEPLTNTTRLFPADALYARRLRHPVG